MSNSNKGQIIYFCNLGPYQYTQNPWAPLNLLLFLLFSLWDPTTSSLPPSEKKMKTEKAGKRKKGICIYVLSLMTLVHFINSQKLEIIQELVSHVKYSSRIKFKVILICIMLLLCMITFFVVTKATGKPNLNFSSQLSPKFSSFPLKQGEMLPINNLYYPGSIKHIIFHYSQSLLVGNNFIEMFYTILKFYSKT